jgi:O-succinylbenzoic acid--CoA ligase
VELAEEAVVIFTSGTTGAPRGACLTYGNFLWSAWASSMHLGGRAGERWLACLPWCHVGGLSILMRSVLCGGSVLVHDRFDPEALNASLDADGVTGVSLVPTMLKRLLDARGKRTAPAPLGAVLLGGAAASGELVERAWKLGFPVLPTYGLTEACSQVATLARGESGRAGWVPGSVGRPLFGIEVRIADAEGRTKPAEEAGEIWIRGPTVMKRYLDDPEANACTLRDGWLRSGDVGVLGGHGELRVLDRRSDLVVSGGENVYPAEVESVLLDHPDVEEVGVAAVTDADLGQRVEAWVVVRSGRARDPAALRAFCRTRLAGYKVPRTVHVVTALPRNSLGKLLRRKLPGS